MWGSGDNQAGSTRVQVEFATHQVAAVQAGQQLFQVRQRGRELQHQFKGAAAGQAETVGFVGADAVAHHLRLAAGHAGAAIGAGVAVDQVVLDTATGYAANHPAIAAQRHHRADRAR